MVVSVITPLHNVAEYLPEAVESVFAQTYADWELVLVDDGSDDGSEALCDGYAARDARVRVIHQKNAGVAAARNTGLRAARGEYYYFLDSDDRIAPDCLETLVRIAEGHPGVDMVQANTVGTAGRVAYSITGFNLPEYTEDKGWLHGDGLLTVMPPTVWNKLTRTAWVRDNALWFVDGIIHEDEQWCLNAYPHIGSMAFTMRETYFYRSRPTSIMSSTEWTVKAMTKLRVLETFMGDGHIADFFHVVFQGLVLTRADQLGRLDDKAAYLERRDGLLKNIGALPGSGLRLRALCRVMLLTPALPHAIFRLFYCALYPGLFLRRADIARRRRKAGG